MMSLDVIEEEKCNILFVDDEPNVLKSLRRTFQRGKYNIYLANGGNEGLDILKNNPIDVVVSDMRMPEMNGAEFLEKVFNNWPQTARLLLTGFSDIESTIKAVNDGKILRYISKPWDDEKIKTVVEHAYENIKIKKERDQLQKLIESQNKELKEFNKKLEERVQARTNEIQQTSDMLEVAYEQLKNSNDAFVRVFSDFIDKKEGVLKGFSRRVADLSKLISIELDLNSIDTKTIYQSALLHELGKSPLSKFLLISPINELSDADKREYHKYPKLGEEALLSIPQFEEIAATIRSHCEYIDGSGFPDGKRKNEIPLGSRVINISKDFFQFVGGKINGKKHSPAEALNACNRQKHLYDENIFKIFKYIIENNYVNKIKTKEVLISPKQLTTNMVLAKDLRNSHGVLLLTKDTKVTQPIIKKLLKLDADDEVPLKIFIKS